MLSKSCLNHEVRFLNDTTLVRMTPILTDSYTFNNKAKSAIPKAKIMFPLRHTVPITMKIHPLNKYADILGHAV